MKTQVQITLVKFIQFKQFLCNVFCVKLLAKVLMCLYNYLTKRNLMKKPYTLVVENSKIVLSMFSIYTLTKMTLSSQNFCK